MNLNSEYGVLIERSKDKLFIKNFKEVIGRSLSMTKSKFMLEARLPIVLKYFYSDFEKAIGLYVELEPNEDENGIFQLPKRPDFGWILRTRVRDDFDHVDVESVLKETLSKLEMLDAKIEFIRHQQ